MDRNRVPGTTWADAVWPYLLMTFKLSPMYLWLLIFTLQPHKEERFLYVAYPLIALNAAIAIYLVRSLVSRGAGYLGADVSLPLPLFFVLRKNHFTDLELYFSFSSNRSMSVFIFFDTHRWRFWWCMDWSRCHGSWRYSHGIMVH